MCRKPRLVRALAIGAAFWMTATAVAQADVTLTFVRRSAQLHNAYLDPITAEFERTHPGITVEPVFVTGENDNLTKKVLLDAASGTLPDVAMVPWAGVRAIASNLDPVDLNTLIAKGGNFSLDELVPAARDLGVIDGKLIAVPMSLSTPVLYINVDAFEKAGLDPASPPKTWDEVEQAAKALTKSGDQGIAWGWNLSSNWIFQAMVESGGGKLAEAAPDGYKVTFDEQPGIAALNHLSTLAKDGLMPTTPDWNELFMSGGLGMMVNSSSNAADLERNASFKFVMAPLPTPTGAAPKLPTAGNGIVIFTKDPERQKAAWEFVKFWLSVDAGKILSEKSGYASPNEAELDREIATSKGTPRAVLYEQAKNVTTWHSWPIENPLTIVKILEEMQQRVMLDGVDPTEAIRQAADQVRNVVK